MPRGGGEGGREGESKREREEEWKEVDPGPLLLPYSTRTRKTQLDTRAPELGSGLTKDVCGGPQQEKIMEQEAVMLNISQICRASGSQLLF